MTEERLLIIKRSVLTFWTIKKGSSVLGNGNTCVDQNGELQVFARFAHGTDISVTDDRDLCDCFGYALKDRLFLSNTAELRLYYTLSIDLQSLDAKSWQVMNAKLSSMNQR